MMFERFIKVKSRQTANVLENGILDVGSERFRRLCAVHENGTYTIATGYMHDDDYIIERNALLNKGLIPEATVKRTAAIEDIARLYGRSGGSEHTPRSIVEATTPASQKLIKLVEEVARARASDFKITQHDLKTTIRVKIAGEWQNLGDPWTPEEGIQALTFAFDAAQTGAGHTSMQKMLMQSFSINHKPGFPLPDNVIKLRGQKGFHESTSDIGQHMVFRLFYSDDDPVAGNLDDLGFDDEIMAVLKNERASRQGCVIIGGSTGDGKSTTLIRTIDRISTECAGRIEIVTVEDPVEYVSKAEGVTQIPVKSAGDGEDRKAEYRKTLMHAMRINPDICVMSEIRDVGAAKEFMQFVASGHKGYTTLHVTSANKILFRLIEMGASASELSGGDDISLLMKQTLIPLLCEHCKTPLNPAAAQDIMTMYGLAHGRDERLDFKEKPFISSTLYQRNTSGCAQCSNYPTELGKRAWAGYSRLTAVAECIVPDDDYFKFVSKQDEAGARKHWLKPKSKGGLGGITISYKLAKLLSSGVVDASDAQKRGLKPVINREAQQ